MEEVLPFQFLIFALMNKKVILQDLGRKDYKESWDFQEQLFKQTIDLKIKNRREEASSVASAGASSGPLAVELSVASKRFPDALPNNKDPAVNSFLEQSKLKKT